MNVHLWIPIQKSHSVEFQKVMYVGKFRFGPESCMISYKSNTELIGYQFSSCLAFIDLFISTIAYDTNVVLVYMYVL